MEDLECPYCETEQDVNHDDGFGYNENELHEMECRNCGKNFVFSTSIIYHYEPFKADCLNGEPHKFKQTHTYPNQFTMMQCEDCEERREPTKEEWKLILK